MYNWSYINSLRENYPSDDNYQNILRNPRLLYKLEKEYLAKYSMDADVYYLALKESLDHYVAMRIAKDKSFTETEEFIKPEPEKIIIREPAPEPIIKTETILKDNRGGRLKALQLRMNWIIKKTKSVFLWNIIWIKVNC